jgi:hypothetical protein
MDKKMTFSSIHVYVRVAVEMFIFIVLKNGCNQKSHRDSLENCFLIPSEISNVKSAKLNYQDQ